MTAQLPSREILKQIIETANEIITVNNGTNEDIWENDTATITRLYDRLNDDLASPSVVKALAEFALAAHEQEPVAYMYRDNLHTDARFSLEPRIRNWSPEDISEYEISETPLFSRPAPVPAVPMAVAGFDAATAIRACMDEFPESMHDIIEECAQIAENTISTSHTKSVPAVPDEIEPTIEAIKSILPTSNPDEYAVCIGADMWNACRTAMLNGGKS
ncbi:hypothetical protein CRX67_03890 [Enterobacteriaceae bacterium A-F18]|nr:hypothetical protein CRX67_03890 [Enterobacteriaceae bacterium A-F18]